MSAAARRGSPKTPFLRTSNVLWGEIDLTVVDEMAIPSHELAAKTLRPGDLLVCEGGEIGRSAIWESEMAPVSFQNHLHRLRPLSSDVEPRFYVYFLQSAFTQLSLFEGAANRTTIPNLSRSRLAALEVPVPKRSEQVAISSALRLVRDAANRQRHLARTGLELRHAAMRILFTRGLRGEPTRETDIGQLPNAWSVSPLISLCRATDAVDFRKECDRRVAYVEVSCVDRRYHTIEQPVQVVLRDAPSRARKRIRAGDVLFATVRPTLLRVAKVPPELDDQVCSTAFCVLRGDPAVIADGYLFHIVRRDHFVERLGWAETGASYPAVTDRIVKEQPVPVPPIEEQREIVAILDAIDRRTDVHRKKWAVLEQLFRTLLHDLMTGQIRVDDLERPTAAAGHEQDSGE